VGEVEKSNFDDSFSSFDINDGETIQSDIAAAFEKRRSRKRLLMMANAPGQKEGRKEAASIRRRQSKEGPKKVRWRRGRG
jgi:hypothetical protein